MLGLACTLPRHILRASTDSLEFLHISGIILKNIAGRRARLMYFKILSESPYCLSRLWIATAGAGMRGVSTTHSSFLPLGRKFVLKSLWKWSAGEAGFYILAGLFDELNQCRPLPAHLWIHCFPGAQPSRRDLPVPWRLQRPRQGG